MHDAGFHTGVHGTQAASGLRRGLHVEPEGACATALGITVEHARAGALREAEQRETQLARQLQETKMELSRTRQALAEAKAKAATDTPVVVDEAGAGALEEVEAAR